jgi:broad specificity phosphatase PhoE
MRQVAAVMAVFVTIVAAASDAAAQATIFLVRHAERADAGTASGAAMGSDPELSDAGRARAASLAAMLADAQITAVYTTEYKRTRQTAEPLAAARKLPVTTVKANEPTRLLELLKGATGNVLVVGHSNTVPDLLLGLGVKTRVTIAESEYDNLFVVTMGPEPKLVRLRYR